MTNTNLATVLDTTTQSFDNATLAERVYRRLRDDILSNKYPPNEPLPEESVAATLNVSRAPVREALRKLAADGLVTVIRRQGAVVSSLSPQEFLDAYQVREALEVLALRLAFPQFTSADLQTLEQLNQAMTQHATEGYIDKFFSTDVAFHAIFVDCSGNEKLKKIYAPLVTQMRRYYLPSFYLQGGIERSLEEHQNIIHALKAGDADEAAQLLREHLRVPQRVLETDKQIELVPFSHAP